MRLQFQPEGGDLFPCCDPTTEDHGGQSSSNDTPAPDRAVCQPCDPAPSLGSAPEEAPPSVEEEDEEEEAAPAEEEVEDSVEELESHEEAASLEEVVEEEEEPAVEEAEPEEEAQASDEQVAALEAGLRASCVCSGPS